jgi:hypothetical protein
MAAVQETDASEAQLADIATLGDLWRSLGRGVSLETRPRAEQSIGVRVALRMGRRSSPSVFGVGRCGRYHARIVRGRRRLLRRRSVLAAAAQGDRESGFGRLQAAAENDGDLRGFSRCMDAPSADRGGSDDGWRRCGDHCCSAEDGSGQAPSRGEPASAPASPPASRPDARLRLPAVRLPTVVLVSRFRSSP